MSDDTHQTYTVRLADGTSYGPADVPTLAAWAGEGRIPRDAQLVPSDGGAPIAAVSHPVVGPRLNPQPIAAPPAGDGGMSTLIPYKNGMALAAYYTGFGALLACFIPVIGIFVGILTVVLGVLGLKKAKAHPEAKGGGHAITGIILGSVVIVLNLGLSVIMIAGMASGS